MTETTASDKVMSRIMALLNRAEHEGTPIKEAEACRAKAEAMMMQHQIDRMDLTPEEKSKIIVDVWDINIRSDKFDHEFFSQVARLMITVLTHCGARVNQSYEYGRDEAGQVDYDVRRFKVVGFPEDIAYAERIWFRVFKEFVSNVSPSWDKTAPIGINAYNLAKASVPWIRMTLMANAAGDDRIPVSEMIGGLPALPGFKEVPGNKPLCRAVRMLRAAYKEECDDRCEPYAYNKGHKSQGAYRNSFATSFCATIRRRLDDMRKAANETVGENDRFALAIIDTKEQIDAEFYRLFPEYDPEVQARRRAATDFEAACAFAALTPEEQAYVIAEDLKEQRRWEAASRRARRNYGRVRENPYENVENSAWDRGRKVAEKVNLRDDAEVKDPKRKGLK